ncbi:four helix bundle protein [Alcanivorax nanhaiticus]
MTRSSLPIPSNIVDGFERNLDRENEVIELGAGLFVWCGFS